MKERGKAAVETDDNFSDFNYSVSSDMPCKKHPSSSSIGICAFCLKEKLVNLVCSECGEQRLSSCSCSDHSSSSNNNNRKSCTAEVGSVGRISFLLENEKTDQTPQQSQPKKQTTKREKTEQVIFLRRSSSSCVEIKKNSNGFWKIKRLFRKKKKKGCENGNNELDESSEIWVSDALAVSRSRSVCSLRGGGLNDTDEGSDYRFSSAKISDVTGGILMDSDEPRKSGFKGTLDSVVPNRSIFPVKESDLDDSAFIDLKLDLSSESKQDFPTAMRLSNSSDNGYGFVHSIGNLRGGNGVFTHSGSCRMSVNEFDRGIKRSGKGNKVWKWIFKQSSGRKSTSNRDDENDILKS
ncbi:uncharacterized protein [Nicotiana tomentosiformis]|uniref:uncharacterized protein n=1 Tax=Nicotiana tomentosiformis TaxID=4098 RepID=UPI00051BDB08|nr:uncharacterized protein LOC104092737 [Nicotiana tomentosiformis]